MEVGSLVREIASKALSEEYSKFEFSRFNGKTKNKVYFIKIDGEMKYVLKLQKKDCPQRERKAADFFREKEICLTPIIHYQGDDYIISIFDDDIIHDSPADSVARLALIHQRLLGLDYEAFPREDPLFMHKPREVLWERIENYRHFLDLWVPSKDVLLLKDMWKVAPPTTPELLLHGDPHPGNIVKNSSGETKAIDFEFAMMGNVTTDLAKTVISQKPDNLEEVIRSYLFNSPELPGFSDERDFVGSVLHDVLLEGSYMVVRSKKKYPEEEITRKRGERFSKIYEKLTSNF
jgi:hypothetical protein